MAKPQEIEEIEEKVILVGVSEQEGDDAEDSVTELAELVKTAGATVVGTLIQKRETIHPGTYVGTGKVEEIALLIAQTGATGIVCDDELSPAQLRNLENMLDTKVMDRTLIILDIFAARATTSEGKIQVELAQLKYRLSRLSGLGKTMSRLGGGIGTRGPGEKKLEIDRRLINDRIAQLNRELKEVVKHREITRAKRAKSEVPVVAIVGYTNAGKSTLLNHLTDAEVLEEDKLFATLDPTTRMLELDGHQQVLLTDTVGFIRKLPHHLIEAFKSTLEEAKYADYIFHVVDASNPQMDKQMHIVYETLDHLGTNDTRVFKEVAELGETLKKLSDVQGSVTKAEVAMIYDWDSRWAIDIMKGLSQETKNYPKTCIDTYRNLMRFGVDVDVIPSTADFSDYKFIVAPMLYMLKPNVAERMKTFVENGGHLLATYLTGYVDENQLNFLGGFPGDGLKDLFGVISEEIDTLYPSDTNAVHFPDDMVGQVRDYAEVLRVNDARTYATYESDYYAGMPAVTVKDTGKGSAYYVAARLDNECMQNLFGRILKRAGVSIKRMPLGVECHTREADGKVYTFYLNCSEQEQSVSDVHGYDLITEKQIDGTLKLLKYGVAILA